VRQSVEAAQRRNGKHTVTMTHLRAISGRTVHVALRKYSISLRADSIPVRKYDTELVFPSSWTHTVS